MSRQEKKRDILQKGNWGALLPIGVFLVMYLGLGILFEYGMKIPMGFYNDCGFVSDSLAGSLSAESVLKF